MNCACGFIPDEGPEGPEGGRECFECSAFTCNRCFAEFEKLDTRYADRALCIACNTRCLRCEGHGYPSNPDDVGTWFDSLCKEHFAAIAACFPSRKMPAATSTDNAVAA